MSRLSLDGCTADEFLIAAMADLFKGGRFITVGVNSPIAAGAALLAELRDPGFRAAIHGDPDRNPFCDGGAEPFDMAAQGRLDTFVFGGLQVDGQANINLVEVNAPDGSSRRFPGTFGAATLFYQVRNIILYFPSHTPRTLVKHVDFISAAGTSPEGIFRPGGPSWLLTSRCLYRFVREAASFQLVSIHPGQNIEEVRQNTGFSFSVAPEIAQSSFPDPQTLGLIRGQVREHLAVAYPNFAATALGLR